MARDEKDREDLLAEATALVRRAELCVPPWQEPLVIGFRRDGAASVYFGAGPAYHFNAQNQLRRAYCGGLLYKSERGRLASLERRRGQGQVQLLRHDLTGEETDRFCAELASRLGELGRALNEGRCKLLRQEPADADILGQISDWLAALGPQIEIARSPRVR